MKKETLKNIFEFLEENENKKHKDSGSLKWKLCFNKSITKEDLNVEGDLDLGYCTDLTSLPKNLKVDGYLNLFNTKITSLPEGLEVGGNLHLGYTKIPSLPEGLYVGQHLFLGYSKITSLPKGLKVGGGLYLEGTNITSLPEGLKVGGDLRLHGLEINLLPKGLEVGDDLFINSTPLTKYKQNKLREMIYPGFIKGQITIDI